jgi:translation initiation factor 1
MGRQHSKRGNNSIIYSTDPGFSPEEPAEDVPELAPSQQRLRIRLDTKHRKGKTVTLVEGFAGTEADLRELGKRLKTACGTGGNAKEGQILVQGAHVEQISQLLKEWGYGLG